MDVEYSAIAKRYKEQGNQAYKEKNYDRAITYYTKAIEAQQDPAFYSNRAICYFNLGRFMECINDCNTAIGIDPQFAKAYKKKYQACINSLKFDEAVDAAKIYAGLEKNIAANNELEEMESLKSNYDRYVNGQKSDDLPEALSCINYLVTKIPSSTALKMKKIECLAKSGETREAAQLLKTMHKQNTPEFYYLQGIIELYNGNSEQSKKLFTEGMRLDPENSKCQKALQKARKCEAFKEQGNELIKQKKFTQAAGKYTEALNLDPYNKNLNSVIYSNRALCYMKTGEKIKALGDLNRSLELDPNYMKSLIRRAELSIEREDYTAGIQDYAKIQELDPTINLKAKIEAAKKKERQAKKKDYYSILGVSKKATTDEIKKSYKKLAMKFHPDRNRTKSEVEQKEAADKFKDIAEANGVLTDSDKRKTYDCGQMDFDGDEGSSGFGNARENMHFNQSNMGNRGNMGNMGNMGNSGTSSFFVNGQDMNGMGMDSNQIFSMFFNQGGDANGLGGFGQRPSGMRGASKATDSKRSASQFKGFPGFGNMGGFGQQNGSNFNFA